MQQIKPFGKFKFADVYPIVVVMGSSIRAGSIMRPSGRSRGKNWDGMLGAVVE